MITYRIDLMKTHDHKPGDREIWEKTNWCERGIEYTEAEAILALMHAREINKDSPNKPVYRLVKVDHEEIVIDA